MLTQEEHENYLCCGRHRVPVSALEGELAFSNTRQNLIGRVVGTVSEWRMPERGG